MHAHIRSGSCWHTPGSYRAKETVIRQAQNFLMTFADDILVTVKLTALLSMLLGSDLITITFKSLWLIKKGLASKTKRGTVFRHMRARPLKHSNYTPYQMLYND